MEPNVIVAVFFLPDCPHCEDYLPKLQSVAQQFGHVRTYIMDANQHSAYADHFKVSSTPVTFVLRRNPPGTIRAEGDLDPHEIVRLYQIAERG